MLLVVMFTASIAGGWPGVALGFREPHPSNGGPRSYALSVSGTLAGGAQVKATVRASVDVGLAVIVDDRNAPPPGLVPLGHVDPGTHTLQWDLRVGGQLLAPGRYEVALEVFRSDGHPSGLSFPRPYILTISPDGHTSAVITSLPTTKSDTDWAAVVIGIIVALAIGTLLGVAIGRRRRPAAS